MKKNVFLLCVMMVAMMAAGVGLTGCSKDDDGGSTGGGALSDLTGTWISVNKQEKMIHAALTFSSGNSVDVLLEGAWFVCTAERTADKMILKGSQVLMIDFDDFGNYAAKPVKSNITITFNYKRNGTQLIIDNITMDPEVASFNPRYEFEFDRVYNGTAILL